MSGGRGETGNLSKDHVDDLLARLRAAEEQVSTWLSTKELGIYDIKPMTQDIANNLLGIDTDQRTLVKSETGA